jgi:phosphatidylglycerophosphate synthase
MNPGTRVVPLLYFLYMMTIPLARGLVWLRISPNIITTGSNLIAVLSVACLVGGGNPWLFPLLWLLALMLDICDGIVARFSGKSSAQGSFYDHMSDQVKVILVFFGAAWRYQQGYFDAMCYWVATTFLFYSVVNQVVSLRSLRLAMNQPKHVDSVNMPVSPPVNTVHPVKRVIRWVFVHYPMVKTVVIGTYASIFVMLGNCMLLLLPLSFGQTAAWVSVLVFGVVTLRSLWSILAEGARVNRELFNSKVSWK